MTDPNTPDWLKESESHAPAPAAPGQPSEVVAPPPPPAPAPANAPMTDSDVTADDPDLPGVILTMRLANMGVAVALIVVAVSGSLRLIFGVASSDVWRGKRCHPHAINIVLYSFEDISGINPHAHTAVLLVVTRLSN